MQVKLMNGMTLCVPLPPMTLSILVWPSFLHRPGLGQLIAHTSTCLDVVVVHCPLQGPFFHLLLLCELIFQHWIREKEKETVCLLSPISPSRSRRLLAKSSVQAATSTPPKSNSNQQSLQVWLDSEKGVHCQPFNRPWRAWGSQGLGGLREIAGEKEESSDLGPELSSWYCTASRSKSLNLSVSSSDNWQGLQIITKMLCSNMLLKQLFKTGVTPAQAHTWPTAGQRDQYLEISADVVSVVNDNTATVTGDSTVGDTCCFCLSLSLLLTATPQFPQEKTALFVEF